MECSKSFPRLEYAWVKFGAERRSLNWLVGLIFEIHFAESERIGSGKDRSSFVLSFGIVLVFCVEAYCLSMLILSHKLYVDYAFASEDFRSA